tara:strand:- start:215 stop:556 length:342 start_codon:yes stop_codon:yes gene_type:complete
MPLDDYSSRPARTWLQQGYWRVFVLMRGRTNGSFFLRHFGIPRLSGSVRYGRSGVKPKSLTPFASTFLMSSIAGFMWWDYLDDDDRVMLRLATAMTVAVHFDIYWTLSGRKKE